MNYIMLHALETCPFCQRCRYTFIQCDSVNADPKCFFYRVYFYIQNLKHEITVWCIYTDSTDYIKCHCIQYFPRI